MNKATKNGIDYLYHAGQILNRPGYSLNIVTGCEHHETGVCKVPCYAKRLVETRLVDSPAYPYGFEPTFHPERIRHYGGCPKLIFLNDMGDVGGSWNWQTWKAPDDDSMGGCTSGFVALEMVRFANLNPEHIILLLTKNPAWYGLVEEWPENVWCGFTATDNEEYGQRWYDIKQTGVLRKRMWVSLEPWLDDDAPGGMIGAVNEHFDWLVIGGQSNPDRPVSEATLQWLREPCNAKRFTKRNVMRGDFIAYGLGSGAKTIWFSDMPREYPDGWEVTE